MMIKHPRQKGHISAFADCWYLKDMSWVWLKSLWKLFSIVVVSGHDWDGKGSTSLAGWIGSSFPKKGSPMIWQVEEGSNFYIIHRFPRLHATRSFIIRFPVSRSSICSWWLNWVFCQRGRFPKWWSFKRQNILGIGCGHSLSGCLVIMQ